MHPAIHVKLKKTCSIESGHLFSLLHGPFLMLMCPLFQQWTGLSMGTQIDLWVCSIFSYMSMERDNQRYCPLLAIRRKCRFKTFPPDTKDCYRTYGFLLFITEIISVQSQYYWFFSVCIYLLVCKLYKWTLQCSIALKLTLIVSLLGFNYMCCWANYLRI